MKVPTMNYSITYHEFMDRYKKRSGITTIDEFHFSIVVPLNSREWNDFLEFRGRHSVVVLKMTHGSNDDQRTIQYEFDLIGKDKVYKTMMII